MDYRIKDPTLAVVESDGKKTMVTVPAGSIVTLEDQTIGATQMVDVQWNGSRVLMFAQDLRVRGEALPCTAA